MKLSSYITENKERIIERWKERVGQRLAIKLEESELVNDLPHFLDDAVSALGQKDQAWPAIGSAQSHGRHRLRCGTGMGSLVEEMSLIIEVIAELAREGERELSSDEMISLSRVIYFDAEQKLIVKQAAESHGGSVHVNNRPPYRVRLRHEASASTAKPRRSALQSAGGRTG